MSKRWWANILFFLLTVGVPALGKIYVDYRVETDIHPLQESVAIIKRDLQHFMRSQGIEPLPDVVER